MPKSSETFSPKPIRVLFLLLCLVGPLSIKQAHTISNTCEVIYIPNYLEWDALREPIAATEPTSLKSTGGVVTYNNLLIVADPEEAGVHIFDNRDITNPINISFIPIYGANQIAVVEGLLYAQSYVDLVVIDISEPDIAFEAGRLEGVFPYNDTPEDQPDANTVWVEKERGVVTDFTKRRMNCPAGGLHVDSDVSIGWCSTGGSASSHTVAPPVDLDVGITSSTTSMLVVGNYLYVLTDAEIISVSLDVPESPAMVSNKVIRPNLETVFYYNNALYIGTKTGIEILDLSDPADPESVGSFEHAWQCDPVVVDGSIAYSTLRSGNGCGGTLNQLDILDVSDITSPQLITSLDMFHPIGLAIENNLLFIADDTEGTKLYDVNDPANPIHIGGVAQYTARDIIVNEGWGLIVGPNQLVQIDYSNTDEIQILSILPSPSSL